MEQLETANAGDGQIPAIVLPSGPVQGERVIPVLALEPREPGLLAFLLHPTEEGFVRFVQAFEHILEDLGADSLELREVFLDIWEFVTLVEARDCFSGLPVNALTMVKCYVIERPADLKPAICIRSGLPGNTCFVQESFTHILNCI